MSRDLLEEELVAAAVEVVVVEDAHERVEHVPLLVAGAALEAVPDERHGEERERRSPYPAPGDGQIPSGDG